MAALTDLSDIVNRITGGSSRRRRAPRAAQVGAASKVNSEPLIVKDRETRTSDEGVVSTHTEYKGGRVDCTVVVPCLRVTGKIRDVRVNQLWPKVGTLHVPPGAKGE